MEQSGEGEPHLSLPVRVWEGVVVVVVVVFVDEVVWVWCISVAEAKLRMQTARKQRGIDGCSAFSAALGDGAFVRLGQIEDIGMTVVTYVTK